MNTHPWSIAGRTCRIILTVAILFTFDHALTAAGKTSPASEIHEVTTAAAILEDVQLDDQSPIFLFDLDNTIMRPEQILGSSQWYDYLVQKRIASGMPKMEAIDSSIKLWNAVEQKTKMVPVEKIIPNLIAILQTGANAYTGGLTARPLDLADTTIAELKAIGIDFRRHTPFQGDTPIEITAEGVPDKTLIKGGIIFVGPKNDKGAVLAYILKQKRWSNLGKHGIVFLDDVKKNVESLQRALAPLQIPYWGYWDRAVVAWVNSFDPKVADMELDTFQKTGKILSDEAARKLVGATK